MIPITIATAVPVMLYFLLILLLILLLIAPMLGRLLPLLQLLLLLRLQQQQVLLLWRLKILPLMLMIHLLLAKDPAAGAHSATTIATTCTIGATSPGHLLRHRWWGGVSPSATAEGVREPAGRCEY